MSLFLISLSINYRNATLNSAWYFLARRASFFYLQSLVSLPNLLPHTSHTFTRYTISVCVSIPHFTFHFGSPSLLNLTDFCILLQLIRIFFTFLITLPIRELQVFNISPTFVSSFNSYDFSPLSSLHFPFGNSKSLTSHRLLYPPSTHTIFLRLPSFLRFFPSWSLPVRLSHRRTRFKLTWHLIGIRLLQLPHLLSSSCYSHFASHYINLHLLSSSCYSHFALRYIKLTPTLIV